MLSLSMQILQAVSIIKALSKFSFILSAKPLLDLGLQTFCHTTKGIPLESLDPCLVATRISH